MTGTNKNTLIRSPDLFHQSPLITVPPSWFDRRTQKLTQLRTCREHTILLTFMRGLVPRSSKFVHCSEILSQVADQNCIPIPKCKFTIDACVNWEWILLSLTPAGSATTLFQWDLTMISTRGQCGTVVFHNVNNSKKTPHDCSALFDV